jgi:hypothetical protein
MYRFREALAMLITLVGIPKGKLMGMFKRVIEGGEVECEVRMPSANIKVSQVSAEVYALEVINKYNTRRFYLEFSYNKQWAAHIKYAISRAKKDKTLRNSNNRSRRAAMDVINLDDHRKQRVVVTMIDRQTVQFCIDNDPKLKPGEVWADEDGVSVMFESKNYGEAMVEGVDMILKSEFANQLD